MPRTITLSNQHNGSTNARKDAPTLDASRFSTFDYSELAIMSGASRELLDDQQKTVIPWLRLIACWPGRAHRCPCQHGRPSNIRPVEETTVKQAKNLFETNVLGTLRLSRAVLPGMRSRRQGRIINISSMAGFVPAPYMVVSSADKHALEALSETMDHELRTFGVRVAVVQPYYARTNLGEAAPLAARPGNHVVVS